MRTSYCRSCRARPSSSPICWGRTQLRRRPNRARCLSKCQLAHTGVDGYRVDPDRYGLRVMDAPVDRPRREAVTGERLVIAGGSLEDMAAARPWFETMASTIVHAGPLSSGLQLKLINNCMAMRENSIAESSPVVACGCLQPCWA